MRIINNQQGITTTTVVGFVLILVIVGFTGWRVMEANKAIDENKVVSNQPVKGNDDEATPSEQTYTMPDGYIAYQNKSYGFMFAYPQEYGSITKQSKYFDYQINEVKGLREYSKSNDLTNAPSKGINGPVSILAYKTLDQQLNSRKYGPMVKVNGDKLTVAGAAPSDVNEQKVGEAYKDFKGNVVNAQKNGEVRVFKLIGGDEGTASTTLIVVANERLYELRLPNFSDGSYGNGNRDDIIDDADYNKLVANVIASIKSL